MANETEPRALSAALAAPAFVTRAHGAALHAANRHVERWAPEAGANRVRSMRSLGFVDRLVAPWMETAQRSASMRLFHRYAHTGLGERTSSSVSWVFPRPWYQDELDWMAAARQVGTQAERARQVAPNLLTTRGTYVAPSGAAPGAPSAAPGVALPAALYEYVAPSLSLAASRPAAIAGIGFGGESLPRGEAYSPLISLAAVQAAELMTRTVAPLVAPRAAAGAAAMTPGLRSVLTSILARAASAGGEQPTRLSAQAPALETPPAPRADAPVAGDAPSTPALEVAEQMAAQRVRVVELHRVAQQSAQRELAARDVAAVTRAASAPEPAARASEAGAARPPAQPAADLRAAAERAEAELRQRAAVSSSPTQRAADAATADERARTATAHSVEAQRQADAAERARIEDRVAQRVVERASIQRLHDQARTEAAAHARAATIEPARAAAASAPAAPAAPRAPAEVTAAIAGLPPELAALLGAVVAQRPERAMQAIGELTETLRTVELLARGSASGAAFEATRGPRLVMPAGLGGLVSAVDRAQSIAELPGPEAGPLGSLTRGRPALLGGQRPLPSLVAPRPGAPAAPARDLRVPSLPWLSAEPRPPAFAASSALGATAATSPAALSHVAWSDRWLARFAGATPQSLDMISAAGAAAPAARMRALASAAPGVVFVAPDFARGDLAADPVGRAFAASLAPAAPAVSPAAPAAPTPQLIAPPPSDVLRFDDEGETPDDVFAAIAAAASRGRTAPARPSAFAPAAPRAAVPAAAPAAHPAMLADVVAHAAPSAPGAGLSAQLASSPFAAAMRHVLSLPSAPSFDVRSLFGADLGAVYLAGLIGPASLELAIGAQSAPTWATWREAPAAALADRPDRIDRLVPAFDAAYVGPELAPGGEPAAAGEVAAAPVAAPGTAAALTTVRTALLSWELATTGEPGAPRLLPAELAFALPSTGAPQPFASHREAAASASTARRMIDAMALPLLGEATREQPAAWAAPGMLAERAQTWSVAQERSAADLAFDFVPPELVLAARVYGLGPTEAAQAARLAIAGPGQLGAMASTIDRTFVEALAIGRDARLDAERHHRIAAAAEAARTGAPAAIAPVAAGEPLAPFAAPAVAATPDARAAITTAFPTADGAIAAAVAPLGALGSDSVLGSGGFAASGGALGHGAAFGVDRRAPRGAFLWPSATVAALGMNAAAPDGQLSMSVAALELLAAQVVAELGTYTALSDARATALGLGGDAAAPGTDPHSFAGAPPIGAQAPAAARAARTAPAIGDTAMAPSEPREADVLGAAAAMVPASRRARFDALYVALGQSPVGLHWSPAARAARALALAGRGEDGPVSPRQRAAAAWDVLPVVYGGDSAATPASTDAADPTAAAISASAAIAQAMTSHVAPSWLSGLRAVPGAALARGAARGRGPGGRDLVGGDDAGQVQVGGPGLAALSARAGEALGSYIAPAAPPSAPRERQVEPSGVGAVLRPPTAEPEYVNTGARTGGRYGGGEVEIPPWFEAAARKMLAERSDSAGISLAELTLVTAAPATHVAASSRSAPSASPPSPGAAASAQQPNNTAPQIDIEKLANEVYRNILVLMDVARARNGNPYL